MRLVMHTGAHYTEHDRLAQTLMRNKVGFGQRGLAVPATDAYRTLIRDTLNAMDGAPVSADAREILLDVILGDEDAEQVILSDPNFFRTAGTAIQKGKLYPDAASRMASMARLFPEDSLEIFMAIRNPAALLPIFQNVAQKPAGPAFWGDQTPQDVRWSDTLAEIRQAVPDIPITVWCNEDMPLIWSQIIREMGGLTEEEKIVGGFDLLHTIMSKEGMQRFRAYLESHPDMSESEKRRAIAAFLDKFALEDEIEEELDMPGWTEELVEQLTLQYDDDLLLIQQIPGVTVILP